MPSLIVRNGDGQTAIAPVQYARPIGGDPHAYFRRLSARSDCFVAHSLRDPADVDLMRAPRTGVKHWTYDYEHDPDPRRQDALKLLLPEGVISPSQNLQFSCGHHLSLNLFFTFDVWWGWEWRPSYSLMYLHKGTPWTFRNAPDGQVGFRTDYKNAEQNIATLPPGGPYVCEPYVQAKCALQLPYYMDGTTGLPRLRLPYDQPSKLQRSFVEGLAVWPITDIERVQEFPVVGERWTRYWVLFERAWGLDWIALSTGVPYRAFLLSVWAADTQRGPVCLNHQAIAGLRDGNTTFGPLDAQWGAGNANLPSAYVGRGPLVAYMRNAVVLHGTSRVEALELLERPEAT